MRDRSKAENPRSRGILVKKQSILLIVSCALLSLLAVAQAPPANAPYKNPSLPVDERVQDLLGRMTLEEKVAQMVSTWQNWGYSIPESQRFVDPQGKLEVEKAKALLKNGLGEFSRPSEAVSGANHGQIAGPAAMATFTNR